jgi:hypothetical protein
MCTSVDHPQNDLAKFGYKNGSKRIEVSFYIFGYPA